ncbi:protein kinase C theta type-like [Bufo gargarizans]|uniref:protein kinase C theta type-like n=1 Tax=Bufo gargarizans TaxID=30331 RepID=UPI001CF3EE71|nr:protein kinase C theta type-like [Bufo gargarizans]
MEDPEALFTFGQSNQQPLDMDSDTSEVVSKRKDLERERKIKRDAILTEKRKIENLKEADSAISAYKQLQETILNNRKNIREEVPARRRINKENILKQRRNINSAELEPEELLQITPKSITCPRSESSESLNLRRLETQKRIKNNRDWVLQSRRRLRYMSPVEDKNCANRSRPSSVNITSRQYEHHSCMVSPANTSGASLKPCPDIWLMPSEHSNVIDMPGEGPNIWDMPAGSSDIWDMPSKGANNQDMPVNGSFKNRDVPVKESLSSGLITTKTSIDHEDFHFLKELGKGGYGKVLLAQDPDTEELLAVKIMQKKLMNTKISVELEIMELAVRSRFLTYLRTSMETAKYFIIVMDYMAGGDLRQFMAGKLPLNMDTARFFASEMVCGLQFLHEHGIIHRDIKPANVLLDNIGHIRIADFGLCAIGVFGEDKQTGYAGTVGYIAPEMMNREPYNHLVDSFAFGVTVFKMLTGDQPFNGYGTRMQYKQSLQEDEPYYPAWLCPDAINILEGLLSKSPCSRLAVTSTIRSHPFFRPVNWADVESGSIHPPFHMDIQPSHSPELERRRRSSTSSSSSLSSMSSSDS